MDAFVAKFNDSGSLAWGTYYGGSGFDVFTKVVTDAGDNVYAFGQTRSGSGIHSAGAHSTSFNGGNEDAMLVKFNENGVRSWGTYFGGDGSDYGRGLCIASTGTVYIVGHTWSTDLAVSALHDGSYSGGMDAYVAKVTSSGVVLWATYFGNSSGGMDAFDCAVDSNHNVYIVGDATTTTGVISGPHDNSYNGGDADAFLAKFNTNGVHLWSTYYGGSSDDRGRAVGVDGDDNVYIAGATSSSNFIATSGAHSTSLAGASDAFVARFASDGFREWGTYFGSENSSVDSVDIFTDMEIFGQGINLSGTTNSDDPLISTWDAFDLSHDGSNDAMFVGMSTVDSGVFYSSYNGGTKVGNPPHETGAGVATTGQFSAICGTTSATGDIATSGAHDTSFNGYVDVFVTYIRNFSI